MDNYYSTEGRVLENNLKKRMLLYLKATFISCLRRTWSGEIEANEGKLDKVVNESTWDHITTQYYLMLYSVQPYHGPLQLLDSFSLQ